MGSPTSDKDSDHPLVDRHHEDPEWVPTPKAAAARTPLDWSSATQREPALLRLSTRRDVTKIWPRTEQRPAGKKDARRCETPVARRARAQEDPNRNEEPQISAIPAADTERKRSPEVRLKAGAAARRYTGIGSSPLPHHRARPERNPRGRRRKKGPKKGPFVWSFRSTGAASHGASGNRPASPSDTVTSGGSAGRADIGRNHCRTPAYGVSAERRVEDIHHIGSEKSCASEPDLKNGDVRRGAASPRAVAEEHSWMSGLSSTRRG
ncbi:uncharacterized protein LOC119769838 [Culex quinquefasciatus]|uniref:uncharacterized protein LOC119769838 n=1 Tax=Culex quinquefasciatus TaxID=7176 RepID=UPI0018E3E770|nr:uncharacterized protein LOC119769838 [Culex quinquefasciatus]